MESSNARHIYLYTIATCANLEVPDPFSGHVQQGKDREIAFFVQKQAISNR